jgi:hypothetical protein
MRMAARPSAATWTSPTQSTSPSHFRSARRASGAEGAAGMEVREGSAGAQIEKSRKTP